MARLICLAARHHLSAAWCCVAALATVGCGSGSSTGPDPSSIVATVPAPLGCSGSAVNYVSLSFAMSGSLTVSLSGVSTSQQVGAGQFYFFTQNIVPCSG